MKEHVIGGTELDLWLALRNGSEDAFVTIYQKYADVLYRYGMNLTKDDDLVKDCLQNLFLDLWNKKSKLGETDSIKYYLLKSIKRRIHKELIYQNKKQSVNDIVENYSFNIVLSCESQLISYQEKQEQEKELKGKLDKLTKRQKEAMYLYFYSELSYEEVASIMSLKISSVYDLVYDALKSLKKTVNRDNFVYASFMFFCNSLF
jgi:RNA polymerase sigma factor (sigma-70 family)